MSMIYDQSRGRVGQVNRHIRKPTQAVARDRWCWPRGVANENGSIRTAAVSIVIWSQRDLGIGTDDEGFALGVSRPSDAAATNDEVCPYNRRPSSVRRLLG